jgi:hypothetical protein
MATVEWVLPEKFSEDLKDENGNLMSKRCTLDNLFSVNDNCVYVVPASICS